MLVSSVGIDWLTKEIGYSQQVEPKSIPRKKTPPKIINPFFNDFKQVKTIVKFWGHVS